MIIIHLNIRGIRANFEELKALINYYNADITAVNEPMIKEKDENEVQIRGFVCCVCKNSNDMIRVLLYVRDNISFEIMKNIGNESSALYIQIKFKYRRKFLSLTAIYNPPNNALNERLLDELCTEQSIVIGDLNAKSTLLGCHTTNRNGFHLMNFLINNITTAVVNDGSRPTFLCLSRDTCDTLDWAIVRPASTNMFSHWAVAPSVSSDILPLVLSTAS